MKINKLLTKYNFSERADKNDIRYIVVHYVGALGDAKDNCQYYASKYIGASAHYYVGFDGDIWQSVSDIHKAWHCGAASYVHKECRNENSIGVEMCVKKKNPKSLNANDKDWYFTQKTIDTASSLVKSLMKKYRIKPDHVLRHYDVTGKTCPAPYVHDKNAWLSFKKSLA